MGGGADRIAHVVQTIEHGNQVVVLAWKCFGLRNAKVEANLETLFNGGSACALDRFVVIIKAKELRLGESFSHQHGGGTLATPHVRDARAGFELGLHTLQSRNPRTYKVSCVARAEKFLAAMKNIFIMLMPAHACARTEGFGDPG